MFSNSYSEKKRFVGMRSRRTAAARKFRPFCIL